MCNEARQMPGKKMMLDYSSLDQCALARQDDNANFLPSAHAYKRARTHTVATRSTFRTIF